MASKRRNMLYKNKKQETAEIVDHEAAVCFVYFLGLKKWVSREGTVKVGDRLLAVDGRALSGCGLSEAQELLKGRQGTTAWLTIEYDVSVMSGLRRTGPLLVEIDSAEAEPGGPPSPEVPQDLGLGLIDSSDGRVIVSKVRTASIAERCGALLPGDQILGVNEWRVEGSDMSAEQVNRVIQKAARHSPLLQIEILPVPSTRGSGARPRECPPSPTLSGASSCATTSQQHQYRHMNSTATASCINLLPQADSSPIAASSSSYSPDVPSMIANLISDNRSEVRVETGVVTLHKTPGYLYGITLRWVPSKMAAVVCDILPNGLADRSGVIQIGDRVTSISSCGNLECVTSLDDMPSAPDSFILTVQFDVDCPSPSLMPTSTTTFAVRLTRSLASGFGITINGCSEYVSSIVISHIRWGSVAHRSGRLSVGDTLLAIDDTHIGGDIHLATRILHRCTRNVTFLIMKHSFNMASLGYSSPGLPSVDSAVESWDSCEQNPVNSNAVHQSQHYGSDAVDKDEETGGGHWINADAQQSDNETCSSYRLSEGVAYSHQSQMSPHQQQLQVRRRPRQHQPPPCPLQTNYKLRNVNMAAHWRGSSINNNNALNNLESLETELSAVIQDGQQHTFRTFRGSHHQQGGGGADQEMSQHRQLMYSGQQYPPSPSGHQQYPANEHQPYADNIIKVSLLKDPVYEDFGFSVSDGLYERGVFINKIRPGGPAHLSRMLYPYDRIIQVNDTKTDDFDCCLTVPLVASAGNRLTLTVLRQGRCVQVEADETNGDRTEAGGDWVLDELVQGAIDGMQPQAHQPQMHQPQVHRPQMYQPPQQQVASMHNTL
ncbi:hypothetical protein AAG570_004980 [Ranatra chinensis]|uniref:PDZ domain-containing protein n=1 Tax=Ranatra chinensis TaxID=642074 RepID=A0ABD0YBW0_9HEMI